MKKTLLSVTLLLIMSTMLAQSVTVRFTARSTNGQYHPFESVRVENETQGWSQLIDYPDTIIVLGSSESIDVAEAIKGPQIKVYPNPFAGRTSTELQICEDGEATVTIMRINGSVVSEYNGFLKAGIYRLNVSLAEPQVAFLCVSTRSGRTVAKMVNTATGTADKIDISYLEGYSSQTKAVGIGPFNVGDQMSYNANYTSSNGITISNTVTKSQTTSELITLFFTESSSTTLPTVTTSTVSNTTSSTATCGGNVTNDGNATVTARGVCWSTSHNPTVSNSHTTDGSGTGSFTSSITGLSANTTYYVRAYATNSAGTAYGNEVSFTTPGTQPVPDGWVDLGLPSGLLWATCNLGPEERDCYYSWGESEIYDSYGSWDMYSLGDYNSLTDTYTLYKYNTKTIYGSVDNKTVLEAMDDAATLWLGGGARIPTADEWVELLDNTTGEWTQQNGLNGWKFTAANGNSLFLPAAGCRLSGNGMTSYYGTSGFYWSSSLYTDEPYFALYMQFESSGPFMNIWDRCFGFSIRAVRETTSANVSLPTVTTSSVSSITSSTATCGGNVTNDGNATVTARGVCWSTSHNPTVSNSHTTDGSGTGNFTSSMTGLSQNTTYYVRAYATNSAGTAYGEERTFITNTLSVCGFDDNGASNAVFTVASGRTVKFSRGNLQYQASTGIWRFAEHQYDYVGSDNASISSTYSGWIDLFGWGTSGWNSGANAYQPWATSRSYDDYWPRGSYTQSLTGEYANADWGVYNAISNGGNQAGMWRTLTKDEWDYLLFSRAASTINGVANARYAKAVVNGKNGLVIFPDNFTMPSGMSDPSFINASGSAPYDENTYTESEWSQMEGAGCVFLPAAGRRNGTDVSNVGTYGYYWSSSYNNEYNAWDMRFGSGVVYMGNLSRNYGVSVRLVRD